MRLPFLNRERELSRLARALASRGTSLVAVYGRRRLGKSRLVQQALADRTAVYYVGDDRDGPVQRASLAREVARLLPGFAQVGYPGWEELLERFWRDAPDGTVLALDEFPALVQSSPELPSLLQKIVDRAGGRQRGLVLCGSSQRMMHGLVLDAKAPLYGRAQEILKIEPLHPHWLKQALHLRTAREVVEHFAVWGGVPRYWELAVGHRGLWEAVEDLLLDPLSVLQGEPERLLLDDVSDVARVASILAVIGQGMHRLSEIAGRLGLPATSLSRPLARLQDLGLIRRETPFGVPARDAKRSLYRLADPLLAFHYRFVEANRSWLATGQVTAVRKEIEAHWPAYLGHCWEQMVRESVGRRAYLGQQWQTGTRWWGKGLSGANVELDVLAPSTSDVGLVLVGEAKLAASAGEIPRLVAALKHRAADCPALADKRLVFALWILRPPASCRDKTVFGPEEVIANPR